MAPSAPSAMPSGCALFTSMPDFLVVPEFVFGGLVWILVASSKIPVVNPQGWVMFVSVFCFVFSTVWSFLIICGAAKSKLWPCLDVAYHALAALFYLSASVAQAIVTYSLGLTASTSFFDVYKQFQLNIAAVVMAYVATLLYVIHTVFSARRWKSS
ncbi:myelin and lymphocyte protein isoform X2 [Denticeps clupeoides]|uniref:Myelin and lymphocyte protein n=1 Tax=Denticeps clupeoides TaxID=299321 RepID=A0AAY4BVD1_9TELE|nr:myelin and lymphocyte protein isoform X2 [Denticeps clupeoides]